MTGLGEGAGRSLRVLVVDDEPLGRQRVLDLLDDEPDVTVVGTAADGTEAVETIRALHPDIVFLDVQMPRMTGLEVVQTIGPAAMPATVFVTAYDQYALNAFDAAAVDYLVKPFRDERFREALRRARTLVHAGTLTKLHERLLTLLQGGAPNAASAEASPQPRYLERVAVQMKGRVHVVPVERIEYVTASGPYVELFADGKRHLIRESMQHLEEQLDPERFIRIHRSAIVRLDLIETLIRSEGSEYHVIMKGGVRFRVGRSRREALELRLGGIR